MKVKLYSTPTCPYCIALKEFLDRHNVHFTNIDVSKDSKSAGYIMSKTNSPGVPQVEITFSSSVEPIYLIGWDEDVKKKLKEVLKLP